MKTYSLDLAQMVITARKCKCFRMVKETYRNRLNHIAQIWLIVYGLVNLNP